MGWFVTLVTSSLMHIIVVQGTMQTTVKRSISYFAKHFTFGLDFNKWVHRSQRTDGCKAVKQPKFLIQIQIFLLMAKWHSISTGKNNGFPFLDILGYLKNTHKNPKFGRVRQVPIRELGWEFPGWDLSHFAKFGIFMGIL